MKIVDKIKLKTSFLWKSFMKFLKVYFSLPHIWISIIISILCVVTLFLAMLFEKDTTISSIMANIFAGLLTGLVISVISLAKGVSLYRTKSKIEWLNSIHKQCLQFINDWNKIFMPRGKEYFSSDDEKYYAIYDLASLGNGISLVISQSKFKKDIPFNPYKFCKKCFDFDAIEVQKNNEVLKDFISTLDNENINIKLVREQFNDMEKTIRKLNMDILNKIRKLEIKVNAINIT